MAPRCHKSFAVASGLGSRVSGLRASGLGSQGLGSRVSGAGVPLCLLNTQARAWERASERVEERVEERAWERASERASERVEERASERVEERASERVEERERAEERARERVEERARERGEPLPSSLVDLVWNSPISSLDDLRHLLEEEAGDLAVEAQPALQAECKVRTEVQEVSRAMLDRNNANFMLWPPCVEVPELRLPGGPPHPAPLSPYLPPGQPLPQPQPQPQPYPAHPVTPPKSHTSKAELHRHDDQKHNQQPYQAAAAAAAEEREQPAPQQWQQGGYTQLARWTPGPGAHHSPAAYTLGVGAGGGGWTQAGAGTEIPRGPQDRAGPQGSGSEGEYSPEPEHSTQYMLNSFQSDASAASAPPGNTTQPPANHRTEWKPSPSAAPANQKDPALTSGGRATAADRDRQTVTASANHRTGSGKKKEEEEEEESGSANRREGVTAAAANQRQDRDSGRTTGGRGASEGRRQKLLGIDGEPHPPHPHPSAHLPQHRPKTTAPKAVISPGGPTSPSPVVRKPRRPAAHRRRRKHRNRISKAAIRAIIM
ncbi:hypothetical protein CRUP_017266 [Coryphaenoides rupestris]|nr:hypothetical protein CRUP_017266 [Coryphaenoides rupestris]